MVQFHVVMGRQNHWQQIIGSLLDKTTFRVSYVDFSSFGFDNVDCVVPFSVSDALAIAGAELLGCTVPALACSPEVIRICDDKLSLNRWLDVSAFSNLVPRMMERSSLTFPCIYKKRFSENGVGSLLLSKEEDLERVDSSADGYFQEYIDGSEEFCIHLMLSSKRIAYYQLVHYKHDVNFYVKGADGPPFRMRYIPYSPYVRVICDLVRALGFNGLCCVNFKVRNGVPYVLEINPRFGYSLCFDINRFLVCYLMELRVV